MQNVALTNAFLVANGLVQGRGSTILPNRIEAGSTDSTKRVGNKGRKGDVKVAYRRQMALLCAMLLVPVLELVLMLVHVWVPGVSEADKTIQLPGQPPPPPSVPTPVSYPLPTPVPRPHHPLH